MSKTNNQKLKLLYLAKLFQSETDEQHRLTAQELILKLDQTYNIELERKTLYSDIDELKHYGMDIINEKDVIKYMNKFRGVALDVFENEPLDKNSELWEFDNIIITPHNSWASDKNEERTFNMIYDNLKKYIENKPLKNTVDILKGY